MKRKALLFLFTLLLLTGLILPGQNSLAQTPTAPVPAERLTAAQDFVALLNQGAYAEAVETFDPSLVKAETLDQVEQAWSALLQQAGAFQKVSEVTPVRQGDYDIVYVTADFEKGPVDIQVVFNPAGQIIGMFFKPAGTGKQSVQPYQPAEYSDPAAFSEQDVTVKSGEYRLPGTLTMPVGEGPFPAIVLVHGSGPNDRDETIGPNKPFRDLAEGLASQGIAVLRYDKRTKVYGQEMTEQIEQLTVREEVTDDALAAIDLLRQTPGVDLQRIFLLGHSLGGLLAPRIAEAAPDLAGTIILAGPTRELEDIIVDQVSYLSNLDGAISADEEKQIELLKQQAERVKDPNLAEAEANELPLGMPAAYWLDLRAYDPAATAQKLAIPLLILRGERDYQVSQADFDGWQQALAEQADVFLKQYPDLNHLFIAGSGPANPQEYDTPGHVASLVVSDIADFINSGTVNEKVPLLGGALNTQEITRLVLLVLPIFLVQLGLVIFCLVDLAKRRKTHGPRWMWAVLLTIGIFGLPTGLIIAAVYLIWGRKEDEDEDGSDDQD